LPQNSIIQRQKKQQKIKETDIKHPKKQKQKQAIQKNQRQHRAKQENITKIKHNTSSQV